MFLSGCGKTDEEKLVDVCVDGLKDQLEYFAKYDGWVVENPKTYLYKMKLNEEETAGMEYIEVWDFEIIISDFTVKNGFNANVRSTSSCTGSVHKSKRNNGKYKPPSKLLIKHTLNGKKLNLL